MVGMDQNHPNNAMVLLQISNFNSFSACISVSTTKTIHFTGFTALGHDSGCRLWRWRFGFGASDSKAPTSAWQGHDICGSKFGASRWLQGIQKAITPKMTPIGNQLVRDCFTQIWWLVKAETSRRCCARDSPRETPEIGLRELQFNWF